MGLSPQKKSRRLAQNSRQEIEFAEKRENLDGRGERDRSERDRRLKILG